MKEKENEFVFNPTKYGGLLNWKAGEYIMALKEDSLYGKRVMFKDYMVKLLVKHLYESYGYVKIYYNPSERRFKISLDEIKCNESKTVLSRLWDKVNPQKQYVRKAVKNIWI